jgi:hypothetical protein
VAPCPSFALRSHARHASFFLEGTWAPAGCTRKDCSGAPGEPRLALRRRDAALPLHAVRCGSSIPAGARCCRCRRCAPDAAHCPSARSRATRAKPWCVRKALSAFAAQVRRMRTAGAALLLRWACMTAGGEISLVSRGPHRSSPVSRRAPRQRHRSGACGPRRENGTFLSRGISHSSRSSSGTDAG